MIKSFPFFTYLLFVILLSGCEYERISTDCSTNAIVLNLQSVENTSCGTNEGEIVVTAEGGDGEYEFSINESAFTKEGVFSNLSSGTYEIVARDAITLCISDPITEDVLNIDGLQITLSQKSNTDCGSSSGSISITQENGLAPIEYRINNGEFQQEATFTGLSSGVYNVTAKDALDCESSISNIRISTGVSLSDQVQPIIIANCAVNGCHNGAQSPNLSVKENIINNASNIRSRTSSGTMPPAGRQDLTQQEIDLIACWVNDGSLNN
ncbi:hypothetical protein JKA74_05950 [Marivirga sp. S37H4]|uniref:Cytochrome c domain-containing protein n=1 Tax=Marivirga aurantiaca TaxID=2802615 RepID=A0A934WXE2_9BACT|nr:hypothetical protein [Marivirga aurantiaca]MBK6264575.1 hypothetical protein [Marivirga aurantiaca]